MDWLLRLPVLIALAYAGWQLRNFYRWQRAKRAAPPPPAPATPPPSVAVIVPFRNEAAHLPDLLASLLAQDYPADRLRLIFVDDHSTDGGARLLDRARTAPPGGADAGATSTVEATPTVDLLRLADHPAAASLVAHKKAALALAIEFSRAELIITTDADCHWPVGGVRRLVAEFRGGADVVLGPVFIAPARGLCAGFQALDLAAYQLLTAATARAGRPALANGANFAFRREIFRAVGGYAGVDHLPSGDDVLLLHKFTHHRPRPRIVYAASGAALVLTRPVIGWRALWQQRLRWAGKAGQYASFSLSLAQALTFVTCLAIAVGLLVGLANATVWRAALLAWAIKAVVDGLLLLSVCRWFGRGNLLRWYLPVQLLYPFYLVAIGGAALAGFRASWKGRPAPAGS